MKERQKDLLTKGLTLTGTTLLAVWVSRMALNHKQREAILIRDDHKCQAQFPHRCNDKEGLEVHHIIPQGLLKRFMIDEQMRDNPLNLLSLCKNAHREIHPDVSTALRNYHEDKQNGLDSFREMSKLRAMTMDQRLAYYRDQFDRSFQIIAMMNTQKAKNTGWKYPGKRNYKRK